MANAFPPHASADYQMYQPQYGFQTAPVVQHQPGGSRVSYKPAKEDVGVLHSCFDSPTVLFKRFYEIYNQRLRGSPSKFHELYHLDQASVVVQELQHDGNMQSLVQGEGKPAIDKLMAILQGGTLGIHNTIAHYGVCRLGYMLGVVTGIWLDGQQYKYFVHSLVLLFNPDESKPQDLHLVVANESVTFLPIQQIYMGMHLSEQQMHPAVVAPQYMMPGYQQYRQMGVGAPETSSVPHVYQPAAQHVRPSRRTEEAHSGLTNAAMQLDAVSTAFQPSQAVQAPLVSAPATGHPEPPAVAVPPPHIQTSIPPEPARKPDVKRPQPAPEVADSAREIASRVPRTTEPSAPSKPAQPSAPAPPIPATHPPAVHPSATHPPVTHPPATHPPSTHPPATHPPATHPPATHPPAQPSQAAAVTKPEAPPAQPKPAPQPAQPLTWAERAKRAAAAQQPAQAAEPATAAPTVPTDQPTQPPPVPQPAPSADLQTESPKASSNGTAPGAMPAVRIPQDEGFVVVVKSIPYDMQEDELKQFMRRFGDVISCTMMRQKQRHPAAMAFLGFSTAAAQQKALEAGLVQGEDFELKIEPRFPKIDKRHSGGFASGSPRGGGRGRRGGFRDSESHQGYMDGGRRQGSGTFEGGRGAPQSGRGPIDVGRTYSEGRGGGRGGRGRSGLGPRGTMSGRIP